MRRWILTALVVLTPFAETSFVHAQDGHKRVLVLFSTRRDSQFSTLGDADLARILDAGLGRDLDFYSEYIDYTRFPDPEYKRAFRDFLALKYKDVRFDLLMTTHEAASEFISLERESLFPGTPVVFLSNRAAPRRIENSSGLIRERNFEATLTFIRQLQPDLEHLFIVSGAADADRDYETAARQQLPRDPNLDVTYLSGLPTSALERRLSTLPPRSAVFYLLVTEDGDGNKFHPLEYIDRLAATANAPTYCWVDSAMQHGILGGSLYSQKAAIEALGQLALRILHGESPDTIPITALKLNTNQIDWRQLQRWRIPESRLPDGTQVLFREPSLWGRYKGYVLAALAVLLTQTALIAGLLIQRSRRRRAEENLRGSQSELLRSYERNRDLGARLLRAQETERSRIAGELHDDICQRMLLLTIELESLRRGGTDGAPMTAALTAARDISKSLHDISHQLHPTRLRMIGLVTALDRLCAELSRAGIGISFTHTNVPTLPAEVMLCLFRVVQEGLQNAVKYSNASQVTVHLRGNTGELTLTVIDNGNGFEVDAAWGKGVGLASMLERLEAIGGSFEVYSRPGIGTRLVGKVPLDASVNAEAMAMDGVLATASTSAD
jgi:signal transduction histidine kinase